MNRSRIVYALLPVMFFAACSSTIPCQVVTSLHYIRPARNSKRVCDEQQAGTTHVAVLSVARWEDYVSALQPTFELSAADALRDAIADSGSLDSSVLRALAISARVSGSGRGEDGGKTPGSGAAEIETPDTGERTAADNLPELAAVTPEVDPMLKHRAAAALFQEVQLINRYVRDAAIGGADVRPYVVRMQVTLMPHARKEPYDAYATISFFNGTTVMGSTEAPVSGATRYEALTLSKQQQMLDEWLKKARTLKPGDPVQIPAEDRQPLPLPRVLPLLVTDDLESTRFTDATERMRTIAAAVVAMSGNAQVSGGVTSRVDDLRKALSNDFNSLLTVTRDSDNTVRARLGAVRSGLSYTMVPQTHNITFLVIASNKVDALSFLSRTTFRDAELGIRLSPRPLRQRQRASERLISGWVEEFNINTPDKDAARRAFVLGEVGDFQTFTESIRQFVGVPTRPESEISIIRDRVWADVQNFYATRTISKSTFDLPAPNPRPFQRSTTLLDDLTAAEVRLIGGEDIDASRLRALAIASCNGKTVKVPAESIQVSAMGDEAILRFRSIRRLLGADEKAKIDISVEPFYAPSPYQWHIQEPTFSRIVLDVLAIGEPEKASPPFSITPSSKFVLTKDGTGTIQLVVRRDDEFNGKIFFSITGASITTVPASVKLEKGARLLTEDGPVDIALRNLTPMSEVVVAAWAINGKKRTPLDDIHIRVLN